MNARPTPCRPRSCVQCMDRPDYENAPDTTNLHLKAEEPSIFAKISSFHGIFFLIHLHLVYFLDSTSKEIGLTLKIEGACMQLRMKVVKGKPHGHCLQFPNGEFMFGRGPECDVRPNSDLVSRQHCLLQVTNEGALIRDLGSRNGTLINGELVVGERTLVHGDTLQLGPLVLEVILETASADAS